MAISEVEPASGQHPEFPAGTADSPRTSVEGVHGSGMLRFIPVSRSDVFERLLTPDYWPNHNLKIVGDALHYIGRLRQQDSAIKLDELMDNYHPFNPDNDMEFAVKLTEKQKAGRRQQFVDGIAQLVFRANFEPITRDELERVLDLTSPYGLEVDVDLDEFEPLLLYYRGVKMRTRSKRDWRWAYLRMRHYQIPSYERLFLALTLKPQEQRIAELMQKEGFSRKAAERKFKNLRRAMPDWVSSEHVYLKMFKEIPQIDINMLLPSNGVKFRSLDRLILWVSGGGSTLYALVVAVLKLALAVAISPFVLVMTLFGFGGAAFRQIMSVLNTRTRYMAELVQKLYFHNISSNQGALTLLIDEAEEEDIKEDALLYAFLVRQPASNISLELAKADIEAFLLHEFGIKVNFDHEEAFGRLCRRNLATIGVKGAIKVLDPAAAVHCLRRVWMDALDLSAGSATLLDATERAER